MGEHSLPAFFVKAPVAGRAPCMVHFDASSHKETIYGAVGEEYRRRGISLLIVDHPGVGEALRLRHLYSGPDNREAGGGRRRLSRNAPGRRPGPHRHRGALARRLLRAARRRLREAVQVAVSPGARIFDFGGGLRGPHRGYAASPPCRGFGDHAQWVFGTKTLD